MSKNTEHKGEGPDFAAIRERCEKATPGPWINASPNFRCTKDHGTPRHPGPPECSYDFQGWYTCEPFERYVSSESTRGQLISCDEFDCILSPEDAAFIAHARTDIPLLLDALAAAQSKLTQAEARIAELTDWVKAANGFAWAHEHTCPRHDADEPCNCGLDAFLARPRPTVESYKARIEALEKAGKALVDGLRNDVYSVRNDVCDVGQFCDRVCDALQAFTKLLNGGSDA